MEKKQNPNFVYIYSETLKQIVAVSKKTGDVTCKDGVCYTANEVQAFVDAGRELTLAEHNVKKTIGGEVVGFANAGEKPPEKKTEELDIF